jgi:hypothetical protein
MTFIKACDHITNYTAAHESRTGLIGASRLAYPQNHIESDNRLSWFLGRLDNAYGDKAFYVHLERNDIATGRSFVRYHGKGIIRAYRQAILIRCPKDSDPITITLDYCHTINSNIALFLKDKTQWMSFSLEHAKKDFREFWSRIGAEGDLDAAISEFDTAYNASSPTSGTPSTRLTTRLFAAILWFRR